MDEYLYRRKFPDLWYCV